MPYQPPYTLTTPILNEVAYISEQIGRITAQTQQQDLRLRRINRIRTITGSLAIEGNTLDEAQITAILDGKRVLAPPREIQEAHNALQTYEQLPNWKSDTEHDLLQAHHTLMIGLITEVGQYRQGGVGVMSGEQVIHIAPPASQVPRLMNDLLHWLKHSPDHPLIKSCVFHYEFEFIHPFADGNGRMGRLWQTLILSEWQPIFRYIPVESLIHQHQQQYYQAIQESTQQTDIAPFIQFMLSMIQQAVYHQVSPQVTPQVSPQVEALLQCMIGEMSREQIQQKLDLKDRKSFKNRYLRPALQAGLIEMTIPDKPNSRLQQYRLTAQGKMLQVQGLNP